MWYFSSPEIVFGEDALSRLAELGGERAFIVTDAQLLRLGLVDKVREQVEAGGMACRIFAGVESDPSLETVRKGADEMLAFEPDWIIGVGGGSAMDAAKAMWALYEHPDLDPAALNPFDRLELRKKARMAAVPTTSGTGAEATWAVVLTDREAMRKLVLGTRELMPDLAIVDPAMVMELPPSLTADTGMDALSHAIEGVVNAYYNDFSDALCLHAVRLIFSYLPRAYADGSDREARERMHNAACMAGLGFGNAMEGLAHAMGHAMGGIFHVHHGRVVGVLLPYTIEFTARGGESRYALIAALLGLSFEDELSAADALAEAIRDLARQLDRPLSLQEMGIESEEFESRLPTLIEYVESDPGFLTAARVPDTEELEYLFRCAYEGRRVER